MAKYKRTEKFGHREKAVGGGGDTMLTISCRQKGERTFMPRGNTRLLTYQFIALSARPY